MIKSINYQIQLIEFKNGKIKEMVVPNEDGSYTILLNSRLSYEKQIECCKHALNHIINDDFQLSDVNEIEYHAHNDIN